MGHHRAGDVVVNDDLRSKGENMKDDIKAFLTLILSGLLSFLICGFIVTALWNALIPIIFTGLNPIGYWQGVGLFVLGKFLFNEIEIK